MKLLTKEIEKMIPPYNSQEGKGTEMVAYVKFFTPWSNWTWYAMEYDKENKIFFGLVKGFDIEYGDFSLEELESVTGPFGLKIERDMLFKPKTAEELEKELGVQILSKEAVTHGA